MLSIHPSNSTRVDSVPGRVNSLLVKMNGVVRITCIKLLFSTENLETEKVDGTNHVLKRTGKFLGNY